MDRRIVVLTGALLAVACGEDNQPLGPGIPGGGGDAGPGSSDGPSSAPDRPLSNEVRIEILAPAPMAVLASAAAPEVRARVQSVNRGSNDPSPDPIAPDSVRFVIATDDPRGPSASGTLSGPSFDAEYTGRADLSALPTGVYHLSVSAASRGGAMALASRTITVDAGPKIAILSPRHQGAYKGSVAVDLLVEAAPFELEGTPLAFVGTAPVTLEAGDGPGRFRAILEFARFDPPLIDDQLFRVVARNRAGTSAEATAVFFVDDDGPQFVETQPPAGTVVGGVVQVSAKLTDRAGVLGPSVIAFIGNRDGAGFELELRPDPASPGLFSALFDSRKLTACKPAPDSALCVVWPNLSFRAADLLGNERVVAYDIAIDNQPPTSDLNPPQMRLTKFDPLAGGWVCSHLFDPVGPSHRLGDMPDDACGVGQAFDLRARVEDQGNRATGLKLAPTAGIDPGTVVAYLLDDTSQALAVDVDGDGACDAINPQLTPTTTTPRRSQEVLAVRLAPLTPTGEADFTPDPSLMGICLPGRDLPPAPLCLQQEMTVVIGYPTATDEQAAIWAIEPVQDGWCVGSQLDAHANQIADGWACLVVAAADKVGNASVSHPLRVYIDRRADALLPRSDQCPAPPAGAGPPPDCTGRYDRATGALLPGTCSGRRFASEIRVR
jgi:hypothetical protein